MKILKYFLSLAVAAGMFSACTKLDEVQVVDQKDATPPVLHAQSLPESIVITADNQSEEIEFLWDAASFGASTSISYSIIGSYEGYERALFSGITGTSYAITYEVFNQRLALSAEDGGLGLPVELASDIQLKIAATIGTGYGYVYSDAVIMSVTTTSAEKVYPMIWVIGDYCGWSHDASQFLYSFLSDEVVYEGFVDFGAKAANGFKLTGVGSWNDESQNWGIDGDAEAPAAEAASITLIASGGSGNITAYSKRFYKFSFDRSTLVLTRLYGFDQLGVIGSGAGGWGDSDDLVMEFNPDKRRFWVDAELQEGEIKFRADGGWDVNWGTGETDGALAPGGGNIAVEAGPVRIYAYLSDSNDLRYELNARMYGQDENGTAPTPEPEPEPEYDWYIHGQTIATPDWGRTPLESDLASGGYKALNVEVAAQSQFLFTDGDAQWIGADASLQNATVGTDGVFSCTVGESFATSADKVNVLIEAAGTYDIWFFPAENKAYVMLPGETPSEVPLPENDRWGLVGTINEWGGAPDLYMDEVSAGMFMRRNVALADTDQFKIRFNNTWDDTKNYGLEGGTGVVAPNTIVSVISAGNSGNIGISQAGTYDIYFNLTDSKVYVMTPGLTPDDATEPGETPTPPTPEPEGDWGLVGTINGWGGSPDLVLAQEGNYLTYKNLALTAADEFKLRFNSDWGTNFGHTLGGDAAVVATNEAVALSSGGGNMKVAQDGTYDFYFDLAGQTLFIMDAGQTPPVVSTDVWGVIGDMTGWGEDLVMTQQGSYLVYTGLTVAEGQGFKLRRNADWGYNYGVDTSDPVAVNTAVALTFNAANITVAAGTYDIYFDEANTRLFIMEQGQVPAL